MKSFCRNFILFFIFIANFARAEIKQQATDFEQGMYLPSPDIHELGYESHSVGGGLMIQKKSIFNTGNIELLERRGLPLAFTVDDIRYGNCDYGAIDSSAFRPIEMLNGSCLPAPELTSFQIDYSRDLGICACLEKEEKTLLGHSFELNLVANPELRQNSLKQTAMNQNVIRLNSMLEAEQNAMQFQASTLPGTDHQTETLISAFASRATFKLSNMVADVQAKAEKAYRDSSSMQDIGSVEMHPIVVKPSNGSLINPPRIDESDQNFCIPLRKFMTAKQIPTDPMFFEDIAKMPTKYKQEDWDYSQLKNRFLQEANKGEVPLNLKEALQKPEAKKIFLRLQFLERNPLYRNLFSSEHAGAPQKKQELYDKIRAAYGPQTPPNKRVDAFNHLRFETGAFFTSPPDVMNDIVQNGANVNLKNLLEEVPRRVKSVSMAYDPAGIWLSPDVSNRPYGSFIGEDPMGASFLKARQDPAAFERYCPRLEFARSQNQYLVLKELEESFASTYSSEPWGNHDFALLSGNVCTLERHNGNKTSTWTNYMHSKCAGKNASTPICSEADHSQLLAQFLEDFPQGTPESAELDYLIPFLKGEAKVPAVSNEAKERAVAAGNDRNYMNKPGSRQALAEIGQELKNQADNYVPLKERTEDSVPKIALSTRRISEDLPVNSAQPVQTSNLSTPSMEPGPNLMPVMIPQKTETLQAQARQVDTESQLIRNEISNIRNDIERESSKSASSRDENYLDELNEKFAMLERKLAASENEYKNLNSQIQSRLQNERSQVNQRQDVNDVDNQVDSRRRETRVASGSQEVIPQQSAAAPVPQAVLPSSQAQLESPVSGNSARASQTGASRSMTGTESGNLLSKYNIQENKDQSGIVVSDTSSTVSTTIEVPLSFAEFEKLPLIKQEQYLSVAEKGRTVYRMSFNDGERILVRDGEKLKVVTSEQTQLPSRLPASDRNMKREDLVKELESAAR